MSRLRSGFFGFSFVLVAACTVTSQAKSSVRTAVRPAIETKIAASVDQQELANQLEQLFQSGQTGVGLFATAPTTEMLLAGLKKTKFSATSDETSTRAAERARGVRKQKKRTRNRIKKKKKKKKAKKKVSPRKK